MRTHVALLRAVNVGGAGKIAMADLTALFGRLGFDDPKTVLQSGSVVFGAGVGRSTGLLETFLEKESAGQLGLSTDYFVRTAAEWREVVEQNPFPDAARDDPSHLLVVALKQAPPEVAVQALQAAIVGRESVEIRDRHAYVVYPDGIGRSKLTMQLIERKLDTRGTGRNWNTVQKITELLTA